jgi:FlaA1/EpsC-like NDP-sugar epimerase
MGEQISVVDMARNLIRLSGFVPDKDIVLAYLGRRPGEKLVEELVACHETVETTSVPKVLCVHPDHAHDLSRLPGLIIRLEQCAAEGNVPEVLAILSDILPTYRSPGLSTVREAAGDGDGGLSEDALSYPAGDRPVAGLSPMGPHRRR